MVREMVTNPRARDVVGVVGGKPQGREKAEDHCPFLFSFQGSRPFAVLLNGCQGNRAREKSKVIWILDQTNALFKNMN